MYVFLEPAGPRHCGGMAPAAMKKFSKVNRLPKQLRTAGDKVQGRTVATSNFEGIATHKAQVLGAAGRVRKPV